MLQLTCERAQLADGLDILELGCGWGSLTLYMAERYPSSKITAVSNSASQRAHIESQCQERGFKNVQVITCDVNSFAFDGKVDRVVSVEMFEHMKNYRELMRRIASWLNSGGKLFVHIFSHKEFCYHYEDQDGKDWLTRNFLPAVLCRPVTFCFIFSRTYKSSKSGLSVVVIMSLLPGTG